MNDGRGSIGITAGALLLFSAAALLPLSCGSGGAVDVVSLDQPFVLASGDSVKVLDADLSVQALEVIEGLEGTMESGAGSALLLVDHGIELDIEVYLESGGWKTLGEYELHLLGVESDDGGRAGARLQVR